MGNENSLPSIKQIRIRSSRSAKAARKIRELNDRQCSMESTDSNLSTTVQMQQQTSESFAANNVSYPPPPQLQLQLQPQQPNSQHENFCTKLLPKGKLSRQLSREPFSEQNLKNGFLMPQMTYGGKENQRLCVERRRSKSLCTQQLRADCQAVAVSVESNQPSTTPNSLRRSSNGVVQPLTRLRIQQCFKAAKPNMGQLIMKRACSLRSEIRSFLSHLPNEKVDELASDFYIFLNDCVENTDDAESVKVISKNFGEQLAQLSSSGFRPDYLTPMADAAIAECVKLDGGAHKRCETLSAWSQLITVMFTNVRDGYYEMMRKQRRISLPHFQAKLNISMAKN